MNAATTLIGELPEEEQQRGVRAYGIPRVVLDEAYGSGSRAEEQIKRALFKPRGLCWELGVLNARSAWHWKRLRIDAP